VVCNNWEQLKSIWRGSPATVTIANAVTSYESEEEPCNDLEDHSEEEKEESDEGSRGNVQEVTEKNAPENSTPKFVDNKRKNMEKQLSANQRDQLYLNMAKDELKLKQSMVDQLATATNKSNKVFEKISQSMESMGKSIGDGL